MRHTFSGLRFLTGFIYAYEPDRDDKPFKYHSLLLLIMRIIMRLKR